MLGFNKKACPKIAGFCLKGVVLIYFRETDIQYAKWLYPKRQSFVFILILSIALHAALIFVLYSLKAQNLVSFDEQKAKSAAKQPIHIELSGGPSSFKSKQGSAPNKSQIPRPKEARKTLTDLNPSSKSSFLLPQNTKQRPKPPSPPQSPVAKEKNLGVQSNEPIQNQNYIDNLREQAQEVPKIQADSGDIPIDNSDLLVPRNGSIVRERYATKDLSLFQFSQAFHEKFGAIWNSEERWVPPNSPLRPGDVIYYKFYINGNGTLEKFENLTKKQVPNKDYSSLDRMISEVVLQVFPILVPPRFASSHNTITDVVAIQVVNGNMPLQFSF